MGTLFIAIAVLLVVFYFFNRERINRVFRVRNKEVVDVIDNPLIKIKDYQNKIVEAMTQIGSNNKECGVAIMRKEDDIKRKEEIAADYRLTAKNNKETNVEHAKKCLRLALSTEDSIKTKQQEIAVLTETMERNKEMLQDLSIKRDELQEAYMDAKSNIELSKICNIGDLLSSDKFTELNMLLTDVAESKRTATYEQRYANKKKDDDMTVYSAKVEEELLKL